MASFVYNDLTAFLPQKLVQVNLYFYDGTSLVDTFAIKQLLEGSEIVINPIQQPTSDGMNETAGYEVTASAIFMQNDLANGNYYYLIMDASGYNNRTLKWSGYIKFDNYERMTEITPYKDVSAGKFIAHSVNLSTVEYNCFKIELKSVIEYDQIGNIFAEL